MQVVIEVIEKGVVVQTEIVTHAILGVPGPPGSGVGSTYVHEQSMPAAVWTINHNQDRFPSVTVVDTAGTVVYGSVQYTSSTQVVLTFLAPFSGYAYLN